MRMPLSLRLRYAAGRYLPFLKIAPQAPDRSVAFRLRPVRNQLVEWETNEEGEALLKIPMRKSRRGKLLGMVFQMPQTRGVQLDEVGTFVWSLCDGNQTVEGIVKQTCKQYKMNRREVEVSVTSYLQMLAERNLIGFYQRGGSRT